MAKIRAQPAFAENRHTANYTKEQRSLNRALITIIFVSGFYICALILLSALFHGIRKQPITNGEIMFIMASASSLRTLFSIVLPIYNFEPIWQVVEEYANHAKFIIHDVFETIYLYFP